MPRKYIIKDRDAFLASRQKGSQLGLRKIDELRKQGMVSNRKDNHKPYKPYKPHYDNPSAGEKRSQLALLASSLEVINVCARARGVTNLVLVKDLADKLKRSKEFRHLFPRRKRRRQGEDEGPAS